MSAHNPNRPLTAGKLPHDLLATLLAGLPNQDAQLLVGPRVGEDAAIIDFDHHADRLLVAKTDPITFATDQIGTYAVNVCANDLAVCGATPRFFLPTVLLPAGASTEISARAIFDQIGAASRTLGVVVAGGHSEVTATVTQPVVAGAMLGTVARTSWVRTGGCRPGDMLLLAGCAPVEGASIIAREQRAQLLTRGWNVNDIDRAANFLVEPGVSIVAPALAAADAALVTAMHDPTEGGIATGLLEIALAAHVGLEVDLDAILVPELAARLCKAFALDPLGTIASGALLATAAPDKVAVLLGLWSELGWPGAVIGRVLPQQDGLAARRGGKLVPFPVFPVDEITRL